MDDCHFLPVLFLILTARRDGEKIEIISMTLEFLAKDPIILDLKCDISKRLLQK